MIRRRSAERKAPVPTTAIPPVSVEIQLHALNTFPKSFLVWGLLGETPMRPKDMEKKLQSDFPYLQSFPFLNRNNFNQYCQRSLKDILLHDSVALGANGSSKHAPTWRLVDSTIKPAAGFLIQRCVELDVNCEDFMATGRNSCPQSNQIRINLLERLSQFVSQTVDNLALHVDIDTTTIDRHLVKMTATGLVEYIVPETENEIRKRSVKGAYARITKKGQDISRQVLRPVISYLNGQRRHEALILQNQPTQESLVRAMEIYAAGLAQAKGAQDTPEDEACGAEVSA